MCTSRSSRRTGKGDGQKNEGLKVENTFKLNVTGKGKNSKKSGDVVLVCPRWQISHKVCSIYSIMK